jgi:predicted enzyme related to lactoylglutathione lyase
MTPENMIDYVEIPARDPARAQAFFTALFGWKFQDYGPDYCSFNDGRLAGGFRRADVSAAAENGSPLIVFYKEDLGAACARVTELGGTVTRDIFPFPGGKRFHFTDPNGNEYAIWSDR